METGALDVLVGQRIIEALTQSIDRENAIPVEGLSPEFREAIDADIASARVRLAAWQDRTQAALDRMENQL
jgi:FtsZ-binding cell division protein ZapB